jgi:transposase
MKDTPHILSADVSKSEHQLFDGAETWSIPNQTKEITDLLRQHLGWILICEPTSTYHMELVTIAHSLGLKVCMVNPREIRHYRETRSFRAKTDKIDAVAIHEFAVRHPDVLRFWSPPPAELVTLRKLLAQRLAAVQTRTAFVQAYGKSDERCGPLFQVLDELIKGLDDGIRELAEQFDDYERTLSLPGVGKCGAAALTYLLNVHEYGHEDSAVAFLGIDLRVRDSGRFRGQRKLTKRGDPVLRYYIVMTGYGLLRCKLAKDARAKMEATKRLYVEQGVIAARKIVRVAYALHVKKTDFDEQKWEWKA